MRFLLRALLPQVTWISLLGLGWAGCSAHGPERVVPGLSTVSNLKSAMGEPARVISIPEAPQAKLWAYPSGCSYQIERDVVVSSACVPTRPEEKVLQHWRHQWIGHTQVLEALPGSADHHGRRRWQLASKQAGMAVIYDEATATVEQVVKYEKR